MRRMTPVNLSRAECLARASEYEWLADHSQTAEGVAYDFDQARLWRSRALVAPPQVENPRSPTKAGASPTPQWGTKSRQSPATARRSGSIRIMPRLTRTVREVMIVMARRIKALVTRLRRNLSGCRLPPVSRPIVIESAPVPADGRILYFSRDHAAFGFLSHFHPSPITLDNDHWVTVEHFYQAQKSDHPDYRAAIRAAETPGLAKRLAAQPMAPGRSAQQSWFRKNSVMPRPDWHDVKLEIMRRADLAKFSQNPDLAALLLATGDL